MVKFSELGHRLNGISTPFGGLTWQPSEAEATIARRILLFLEDRRVLYNPYDWEVPDHCLMSVLEIRRFLVTQLQLDVSVELSENLKAMTAACRKFLNHIQTLDRQYRGGLAEWQFNVALGELRATFGILIAIIAERNHLDVEGDLSTILPAAALDKDDTDIDFLR